MMEIVGYIRQRCRRKFDSFLLHEDLPPPTVFFLVFLYAHSEIESPSPNFSYILFGFGATIALLCNFNFLFTMAPFISCTNFPAAFFMFFICILACNQKWKSYLFFLAIGDSIISEPLSNSIFLSITAIYLCSQAYRKLVFKTLDDNLQFFAGFFAVAIHYSVETVRMNFQIDSQVWFDLPLIVISLILGYSIMFYKIKQLKNTEVSQIRDSRVMAHYLKLLESDIEDQFVRSTKIILHGRKCIKLNCFCQSKDTSSKPEYFLRQTYENSINYFKDSADPLLWQYYMGFLIKNEQILNALHNLTITKPTNYFFYISWSRQQALIKSLLQQFSSPIVYEKQYVYALEYDSHCLHLALEIHDILQMKQSFWSEVGREAPLMHRLQKQGADLVEKMYKLNKFYNSCIKIYEKTLYSFDATVLYGMYLLSTTNFKEYAEIIIKNTSKLLEEVYVFDNSASQTFAIRTVAENVKKSYLSFNQDSLNLMRNPNISQSRLDNTEQNRYKLIIDAVSSGFCRLIKINKTELIGQELNYIIPDGYKQVHNIRLSYLLDFESESLKDIVPSKVMHKQLKLPIKGADNELFMGFVCIKFQIDIEKGLTFVSIIKRVHDKTTNVLMNFKNEITEKEEGFFEKILQHSEVKKYIEQLKENWSNEKVIKEEKFNLMINTANYGVTISSPLLGLFLQKENLRDKAPPIHIQIVNEETNRNRTLQNDKNNKMARQIKKMQTAIVNYDTQSSTSNTKGSNSAISVLTTFSQSNSVSEYRFIQIIFILIIVCCIGSNVLVYASTNLSWDANGINNNPINDTIKYYMMQMLTSKTLLNVGDLFAYFQDIQTINKTQISSYFGNSQYQASVISLLQIFEEQFRSSVYHCLNRTSQLLGPRIKQRLSTYLPVINMINYQIIPTKPFQNMTFLELMMNYLVDFQAMTKMDLKSPVMFTTFLPNIAAAQNATEITTMIDDSIAETQKTGLIIEISSAVLVCLLLIPLGFVLKRRLHIHEKVFDLIVSVESPLVVNQIKSLAYICNILKNYQQSNEILKTNVLQYKQNVIMPKRNVGNKRASADNEIIQGLQKYDKHILVEPDTDRARLGNKRSKRSSSVSNNSKMQSNSSSIFTAIKSQFSSVSKESPNRKRAGQLDLSGSDSDPDKIFIKKHILLYLIIILFVIFRVISSVNNQTFTHDIKERKDEILKLFTSQIKLDMNLLGAKVYLRGGQQSLRMIFGMTSAFDFIYPLLSLFPAYDYNLNNGYEQILPKCQHKNVKYCQYNYSYSVLKGQFGTLFKQLIEQRFNSDNNYKITKDAKTYNATILTISQRTFFLQSLNNRLEQMLEVIMNIHYQDMIEYSLQNQLEKQEILIMSVIWGVCCIIIGFSIIWKLKEQYFRQVYTITFLNSEMVLKNKRVESFLDSLSKSIYL